MTTKTPASRTPSDILLKMIAGIEQTVSALNSAYTKGVSLLGASAFEELQDIVVACLECGLRLPIGMRLTLRSMPEKGWTTSCIGLRDAISQWRPRKVVKADRPTLVLGDQQEYLVATRSEQAAFESAPEVQRERESQTRIEETLNDVIQSLSTLASEIEMQIAGQEPGTKKEQSRLTRDEIDEKISDYLLEKHWLLDILDGSKQEHGNAARKLLRKYFGRNELSRQLGLAAGSVSNSKVFQSLKKSYGLEKKCGHHRKIGLDLAIAKKACETHVDPRVPQLLRRLEQCRLEGKGQPEILDAFELALREERIPTEDIEEKIEQLEGGEDLLSPTGHDHL